MGEMKRVKKGENERVQRTEPQREKDRSENEGGTKDKDKRCKWWEIRTEDERGREEKEILVWKEER